MIELPRELADAMVAHARKASPLEACGLLAGVDGRPRRVYPMRNAERATNRFRFEADEQRAVLRHAASAGLGVLAFFHSHPYGPAVPSEGDREAALRRDTATGARVVRHPGARHVIVSLGNGAPDMRAFRFERGAAVEEEVRIT